MTFSQKSGKTPGGMFLSVLRVFACRHTILLTSWMKSVSRQNTDFLRKNFGKMSKKRKNRNIWKSFFRQNVGKSPKNNLFFSEYQISKGKLFFRFQLLKKCGIFQKILFSIFEINFGDRSVNVFQNVENSKKRSETREHTVSSIFVKVSSKNIEKQKR